jgi:hypothetical protein
MISSPVQSEYGQLHARKALIEFDCKTVCHAGKVIRDRKNLGVITEIIEQVTVWSFLTNRVRSSRTVSGT